MRMAMSIRKAENSNPNTIKIPRKLTIMITADATGLALTCRSNHESSMMVDGGDRSAIFAM